MLNEFVFTKIQEEAIGNILFQHDGATCHTVFEDHIISRRVDVVWPPQSYDLTSLDYYLLDAVKDKCYAHQPQAIDALKHNIREAIGEIQYTTDNVLKLLIV